MAVDPSTLESSAPAEPKVAPIPAAEPAVSDLEPPASAAQPAVGDFTGLFMSASPAASESPAAPGPVAPIERSDVQSPQPPLATVPFVPAADGPGEFTRMFSPDDFASQSAADAGAVAPSLPPPAFESPASDAVPASLEASPETAAFLTPEPPPELPPFTPVADSGPGEFTLAFQTGLNDPPPVEEPKPKSPTSSGTFSQTYVSTDEMPVMIEPLDGPPIGAPKAAEAPAAPIAAVPTEPPGGGFTQLFAAPGPVDLDATAPLMASAPEDSVPDPVPATPAAAAPPVFAQPPATPAAPAASAPGEFTKFFQPGELEQVREEVLARKAQAASPATPAAPVTPVAPAIAAEAKEAPGEFTMMFSAADLAEGVPPPAQSAAAPPADAGNVAAGEFTQMFKSADMGLPTPPEPDSGPGGFGDPMAPPPSAPSSDLPFAPPGAGAPAGGPTFTEYFRAANVETDFGGPTPSPATGGDAGPTPLPETPASAFDSPAAPQSVPAYDAGFGSGGATQFFQMPASQGASTQAPIGPVEQVGPGEYTRMISGEDLRLAMEQGPGGAAPGAGASSPAAPAGGGMGMPVPGVTGPRVSGPYVQGPSISASGVSAPSMSAPSVQGPYMSTPQVNAPHMSAPHMSGPSVSGSGMTGPSMSGPQVSGPNVSGAGFSGNPMQMASSGGAAPAAPAGAPVPVGGAPAAGGSSASKIIIFVTIIVTVIAVSLVLMVAYFALKG